MVWVKIFIAVVLVCGLLGLGSLALSELADSYGSGCNLPMPKYFRKSDVAIVQFYFLLGGCGTFVGLIAIVFVIIILL
ncbi:hypothetical protein FWF48_01025 [Candidatus Saccharibacteria bacterium]|nr:hypothetical protein [Candidatus Saccharibacteria bacterium]